MIVEDRDIVLKATEIRQRSFQGPQTFISQSILPFPANRCDIYTRTERRGNRRIERETERESVRVRERSLKTDLASVINLTVGKTQLTSFWDKLGGISIFQRNYFKRLA